MIRILIRYQCKFRNLYSSPNIIGVRRVGWVGHVAHIGLMRNAYKVSDGKPEGKKKLRTLGVNGKLIYKWLLNRVS
jgi:hypothetical protein